MRRVPLLALTLVLLGACAAFGKTDDAPALPSVEAGAPASDAARGDPLDAGDTRPGDATPPYVVVPPKCPASSVFCDDFEEHGWSPEWMPVVNDKSKPEALLLDEALPEELGTGHALHVRITPSDDGKEATAYLKKSLDAHFFDDKTTIDLRFRVFVVQAGVNYTRFGNWVTIVHDGGYDAHGASLRMPDEVMTHGSTPAGGDRGPTNTVGRWHLVSATLKRGTEEGPFKRETRIDDELVDTRSVDLSGKIDVNELEFGAYSATHAGLGGTFEAWLDDVVFTAE